MNDLVRHTCGECGISWAQPAEFANARRADGKTFYCPNGHARVFRESTEEKLRRELEQQKQRNAMLVDEAHEAHQERAAVERSNAALRGVITRTKKRVGAGVCPCCNRSFSALAAHMAAKHPTYREGSTH